MKFVDKNEKISVKFSFHTFVKSEIPTHFPPIFCKVWNFYFTGPHKMGLKISYFFGIYRMGGSMKFSFHSSILHGGTISIFSSFLFFLQVFLFTLSLIYLHYHLFIYISCLVCKEFTLSLIFLHFVACV